MELNAYKDTINGLIKSASAGNITEVIDVCSTLSNDYVNMSSNVTGNTDELAKLKAENEMLVKANSQLFLQQGSTKKTVPDEDLNKDLNKDKGAGNETVEDIDVKSVLFDEKGGLK